ncbi:hypothetical protein CKALI_00295 [Corynebacterium kalinowskii]|uniref:Uncharacterized protein n=1 Tax=Corynebacterium kalinowskii TaxID=2675216 RepID=A0A6B8VUL7_9CORY|nr:hypothetical protein CKALI_00295 [Corynebacterium kalinowskii]
MTSLTSTQSESSRTNRTSGPALTALSVGGAVAKLGQ